MFPRASARVPRVPDELGRAQEHRDIRRDADRIRHAQPVQKGPKQANVAELRVGQDSLSVNAL